MLETREEEEGENDDSVPNSRFLFWSVYSFKNKQTNITRFPSRITSMRAHTHTHALVCRYRFHTKRPVAYFKNVMKMRLRWKHSNPGTCRLDSFVSSCSGHLFFCTLKVRESRHKTPDSWSEPLLRLSPQIEAHVTTCLSYFNSDF